MRASEALVGNIVAVSDLGPTSRLLCSPEHLANRKTGLLGKISQVTAGLGEILVWVEHGKTVAPYFPTELQFVGEVLHEQGLSGK